MSDFIRRLKEFVEKNKNNEDNIDLWFEYENCKITYSVAWWIVSELSSYELHIDHIHCELEMLQDYTRLLRQENHEWRKNIWKQKNK